MAHTVPSVAEYLLANVEKSGLTVLCEDTKTEERWVDESRGELVEGIEPELTSQLPLDLLARRLYEAVVAYKYTENYIRVKVATRATGVTVREFSFVRCGRTSTHFVEWCQQQLTRSMEEWESIKFSAYDILRCTEEDLESALTAVALVCKGRV